MITKEQSVEEMVAEARSMLNKDINYGIPFPMAVFGTLRKLPAGSWNSRLMRDFVHHSKAFVPHLKRSGLHLDFQPNATCAVEVFFYTPEQWSNMIPSVDGLEGFSRHTPYSNHSYCRTLMEVYLLPEKFRHSAFTEGIEVSSELHMPQSDWSRCLKVPAWIYSNMEANYPILKMNENHILWEPFTTELIKEEENKKE